MNQNYNTKYEMGHVKQESDENRNLHSSLYSNDDYNYEFNFPYQHQQQNIYAQNFPNYFQNSGEVKMDEGFDFMAFN